MATAKRPISPTMPKISPSPPTKVFVADRSSITIVADPLQLLVDAESAKTRAIQLKLLTTIVSRPPFALPVTLSSPIGMPCSSIRMESWRWVYVEAAWIVIVSASRTCQVEVVARFALPELVEVANTAHAPVWPAAAVRGAIPIVMALSRRTARRMAMRGVFMYIERARSVSSPEHVLMAGGRVRRLNYKSGRGGGVRFHHIVDRCRKT